MDDPINSFSGEYRFLSNFYSCSIKFEDEWYTSSEHAYQAAKTLDLEVRRDFQRTGLCPATAKKMGKILMLREDWEQVKLAVMSELIDFKFSYHYDLKQKLVDTAGRELIEGNYWHDTFWGVCEGKGHNHLGKILMKKRSQILSEKFYV